MQRNAAANAYGIPLYQLPTTAVGHRLLKKGPDVVDTLHQD